MEFVWRNYKAEHVGNGEISCIYMVDLFQSHVLPYMKDSAFMYPFLVLLMDFLCLFIKLSSSKFKLHMDFICHDELPTPTWYDFSTLEAPALIRLLESPTGAFSTCGCFSFGSSVHLGNNSSPHNMRVWWTWQPILKAIVKSDHCRRKKKKLNLEESDFLHYN